MFKDGFIAGENDNINFLNKYQVEGEDYGYNKFISSVDSIVVGRRTYDKVIGMEYPYHEDKKVYVITRNQRESNRKNLNFYTGDLTILISQLKQSTNKNIYCDGGAELAKHMIKNNLIDKIILSIIPITLHQGTSLFANGIVPNHFELKEKEEYKTGLIQHTYELTL